MITLAVGVFLSSIVLERGVIPLLRGAAHGPQTQAPLRHRELQLAVTDNEWAALQRDPLITKGRATHAVLERT